MSQPKSILKHRVNNISSTSSPILTNTATSWFSKIQSKFTNQINKEDETNNTGSVQLSRNSLKRVSFSVNHLTTEHAFCCDESPRDETIERHRQEPHITLTDLPDYYEHACIQHEEGVIERFRTSLRASRSSQLKTIDLSNQEIHSRGSGPISDVLMLNFGLTRLHMINCRLNDEAIRLILCSLLTSNTVSHLSLADNTFDIKGYKYIATFIKESTIIKSLDLSRCKIENASMQYLSQGVKQARSLEILIMNDCIIRHPDTLVILSQGIHQSSSIIRLSLRNALVTQCSVPWMVAMVDYHITNYLEHLDLSGNNLQWIVEPLANVLRENTRLLSLKLSSCQITFEGLIALSDALMENKRIESLDLSCNPLCGENDQGVLALKTALSRNRKLSSLNLSNTRLDSSATITLAEALPENTTLTRLDLSKNPSIQVAGILALSISIKMNQTLTFLDINIPPGDEELANLQNDIVAVCTTNMLQKVEAQQKEKDSINQQHENVKNEEKESKVESNNNNAPESLSPSSSLSSSSTSTSNTLEHKEIQMPTKNEFVIATEKINTIITPLKLEDTPSNNAISTTTTSTSIEVSI
ncbi:RNI-like protein [Backusella circina FSU 941]|nr:RNI-like protein [Backusella circina FSU 941]